MVQAQRVMSNALQSVSCVVKCDYRALLFEGTLLAFGMYIETPAAENSNPVLDLTATSTISAEASNKKDIFTVFSGASVALDDFKDSLTTLQSDVRLTFARPVLRLIDQLLAKDTSGKDMIDELYFCIDRNQDKRMTIFEVKLACMDIEGVDTNLNRALPENLVFRKNNSLSPRLQNFLQNNWEDLKTLHFYMRLFSYD